MSLQRAGTKIKHSGGGWADASLLHIGVISE
jgi:hypothetical protein